MGFRKDLILGRETLVAPQSCVMKKYITCLEECNYFEITVESMHSHLLKSNP